MKCSFSSNKIHSFSSNESMINPNYANASNKSKL